MAVAVVGIESDIGDDGEAGVGFFQSADGSRHEAVISGAGGGIAGFEFIGDAWEKDHGRHAERVGFTGFLHEAIKAPTRAAGHGGDGRVVAAFLEKERVDEVAGIQIGLAHEITDGGGLAVAARADGEVHLRFLVLRSWLLGSSTLRET